MALPNKDVLLIRSKSVSEIQWKQGNKTVVNAIKGYKCSEVFNPAYMVQASCKHSADETRNSIDNEMFYLLKIVKELEAMNTFLEENCKLWRNK